LFYRLFIPSGQAVSNAQVVEVTLDNDQKIVCTPDHRFIMRDGSEVEAQHLTKDSSVMPLYLIDAKTGKHQGASKYLKYICPKNWKISMGSHYGLS
jgi:hypothetical protein